MHHRRRLCGRARPCRLAGLVGIGTARHWADDVGSEEAPLPRGEVTTYETQLELPDASQELVERYRDRGDCLMRQSGYLDLLGDTWSCVVQGPDWVDVCVVSAAAEDAGSVVRVQRLERPDADGWWER